MLDSEGVPDRWVMHCFSGDADFARACLDRGAYLSFAGTVTFKNAQPLRDALAVAPADRVLVETDAPFLTPTPHRGQTNASYLVPLTMRVMADVRGADLGELCAAVDANTGAFGGLSAGTGPGQGHCKPGSQVGPEPRPARRRGPRPARSPPRSRPPWPRRTPRGSPRATTTGRGRAAGSRPAEEAADHRGARRRDPGEHLGGRVHHRRPHPAAHVAVRVQDEAVAPVASRGADGAAGPPRAHDSSHRRAARTT